MEVNPLAQGKYGHKGKTIILKSGLTYYELVEGEETDNNGGTTKIKETVVMIHGITWWSFIFDELVPFFTKQGHQVLTFDLYGRGNSHSPWAVHDVTLFVEQTKDLIENVLGKEAKVIILGMSMGGAIASTFMSRYPQHVTKAIIMCPAGINVPLPEITNYITIPVFGWLTFMAMGKSALIKSIRDFRLQNNFFQIDKLEISGIIDKLIDREVWQIENKNGFLDAFHSTISNFPFNGLLPEISKINPDIPVLLMWGDHDNLCLGHETFLEAVPHTDFAPMVGCGHAFIYEDLEQTENHIATFLEKYSKI